MTLSKQWIVALARAGYSARGLVYLIIGFFAVLAAFGNGQETDSKGALRAVLEQPFGTFLIWLMIFGLVGYVIWRLIQALFDTDSHGLDARGAAIRAGLLASAIAYAALAIFALSLIGVFSGGGGGGGGPVASALAGFVGARPMSIGLALIFLGVAGAHVYKAFTRGYAKHMNADEDAMAIIHPVSMIGLSARGAVFAVIAVLLAYRGLGAGESEGTPGLAAALDFVQSLPFGAILLALLGLGLMAFAAYSLAEARWRQVNVEDA